MRMASLMKAQSSRTAGAYRRATARGMVSPRGARRRESALMNSPTWVVVTVA